MLYPSPLEYLAAFAVAFLCGALAATCHCKYVDKLRKEVTAYA